ncbi:MAG TPA: TIGR04168 family protein [Planctomycetota bacterium]|nr:TIGR04168 family protein [Planctomycetota bacterium]
MVTPPAQATLTIVGDMHRSWRSADARFLERGHQDLVLFVGDLGDEDVAMVETVAALRVPKVVLLGNHDAWQSFSERRPTDRLRKSIELLGLDHLAYGLRELPRGGVSVVGARPFSWGGQSLRGPEIYDELYGVHTMRQSAAKIVDVARRAGHRDLLILAHNGPLGLSSQPHDIYGKDFGKPGGDWGDRDLALALQRLAGLGLRVPVVVAGHMHHRLVYPRGAERTRFVRVGDTLFVNPAVVPRVVVTPGGAELSYFVRLVLQAGRCVQVEELWVDDVGEVAEVQTPRFVTLEPAPVPGLDEGGDGD